MLVYAKYEGSDHPIAAARNETVAKVKAMIAARCSSLAAKLFALRHGAVELKDSAALGDYHLSNGAMLEVCVATSQPCGATTIRKQQVNSKMTAPRSLRVRTTTLMNIGESGQRGTSICHILL